MWTPLLLLPALLLQWAAPLQGASVRQSLKGCEYEGRLYTSGTKFSPHPCTFCHCPHRGGLVQCVIQDCTPDVHCAVYANTSGLCCPRCQEYGCRHSDGKLYEQGEVIRNEPCVRCYCPVGGGNPVCDVTSCPMSMCVDPVYLLGSCCPICPNGPNCQIGLLTLPIGQSVMVEGATCTCKNFIDVDGENRTLARCDKD